jgi:hypothetical protein
MSYGSPEWQKWVLGEEEGIAQVKFACVIIIKFKLKRPCCALVDFDPAGSNSAQLRERHPNLRHR